LHTLDGRSAPNRVREEATTGIVQLFMGILSDLVFESVTSRHRALQQELNRYIGRKPGPSRSTSAR
jgi:hypothetical protein